MLRHETLSIKNDSKRIETYLEDYYKLQQRQEIVCPMKLQAGTLKWSTMAKQKAYIKDHMLQELKATM